MKNKINNNSKFYAFDWDDNIVHMPTKILLEDSDGNIIGMSTEDFAKYKDLIGKEEIEVNGHIIVGYYDDPFRFFRSEHDKRFIMEAMLGKPAPSWYDFVECINHASIFAIVTARGHSPLTIKEVIYNFIVSNFNGINYKMVIDSFKKSGLYVKNSDDSDMDVLKKYLDSCKYYPVSYNAPNETNPAQGKIKALEYFIQYVKSIGKKLHNKPYLKKKILNKFLPIIGFSDDDEDNVKAVKKHFSNKKNAIINTYLTKNNNKDIY